MVGANDLTGSERHDLGGGYGDNLLSTERGNLTCRQRIDTKGYQRDHLACIKSTDLGRCKTRYLI